MLIYTIGDIIGLVIISMLAAAAIIYALWIFIIHKICKHSDTYTSGITLDVFCRKCGKNLGFKGNK